MDLTWKAVSSTAVWKGRFSVLVDTLRAAHDGREMQYTHLGIGRGAVVVLALDDHDRAICVRQYRHPVSRVTLELPAGHLDPGEDPRDCAAREFEEETGLRLGRIQPLGTYCPVPTLSGFRMHMFFGTQLSPGRQALDPNELLEVVRVPIRELRDGVTGGRYQMVAMNHTVLLADAKGLLSR